MVNFNKQLFYMFIIKGLFYLTKATMIIFVKVLQVSQGGQPIMVQSLPQGHAIQIQGQPGQQVQQVTY